MEPRKYLDIVSHYESCLERHGDTHLGVDWPRKDDVNTRHRVMLEIVKRELHGGAVRLLDFGCGAAHLYEHIRDAGITDIEYAGLDLSEKFVELCRRKFPANDFYCLDLLEESEALPSFDYIVMNGVFTEKRSLTFEQMLVYFKRLLKTVFAKAEIGIAFNVMSKHVDWEREDLFHLPFDELAAFLKQDLTRNFIIRNDYGLYEYTTYVYR
jgi:SAM-dependent methyltransferase